MRIAILSRNPNLYSTQRLLEAARARGHEALTIDHLGCDIIIDKDGPAIWYKGEKISDIQAIIPIGASVTFYGTAVVRQFEMMNVFVAVEAQAIIRSRDKLRSSQILAGAGVSLPRMVFTNSSREDKNLLEKVGGVPVVIKLLEGTQGLGVVLAETKKAAESVIDAFHGLKARIIIQEFIKEAKAADIRAFVVAGEVVGAMKRQGKEGEFRSNLHRGGTASIIELTPEEKEAALHAAEALGLAIAGVDMLISAREPLILEVNSSPGLEGIEKATGVDIAGKIIEYIENAPKKTIRKIKSNPII